MHSPESHFKILTSTSLELSDENFKWISSSSTSTTDGLEGCFSGSILGDLEGCSLEVDALTLEPKSVLFSELLSSFFLKNESIVLNLPMT